MGDDEHEQQQCLNTEHIDGSWCALIVKKMIVRKINGEEEEWKERQREWVSEKSLEYYDIFILHKRENALLGRSVKSRRGICYFSTWETPM